MDSLRTAVSVACNRALGSQSIEPRVRVWIDGKLDYQGLNKLIKDWGTAEGLPHERLQQICGPTAVLALNGVASWNHEVGHILNKLAQPICESLQSNSNTLVDTYCFITGGPGETAFGAHVDFEDSLIIDLSGVGRVVREWPIGSAYGALKDGAAGHLGSSFNWPEFAKDSRLHLLTPGQMHNIPALAPHIFHALGAGFFLGLSVLTNSNPTESEFLDLHSRPLRPVNDLEFLGQHDFSGVKSDVLKGFDESVDTSAMRIRWKGKNVRISDAELSTIEQLRELHELEDCQVFNELAAKLYHLGVLNAL